MLFIVQSPDIYTSIMKPSQSNKSIDTAPPLSDKQNILNMEVVFYDSPETLQGLRTHHQ